MNMKNSEKYCRNNICLFTSNEIARIMEYENFDGRNIYYLDKLKRVFKIEPTKDGFCIFYKNGKCVLKEEDKSFESFRKSLNIDNEFIILFNTYEEFATDIANKFLKNQQEHVYKPCILKPLKPKDFKINKEYLLAFLVVGILDNYADKDDYPIKEKHFYRLCISDKSKKLISIRRKVFYTKNEKLTNLVDIVNLFTSKIDYLYNEVSDIYVNKINSILKGLHSYNLEKYKDKEHEYLGSLYILHTFINMYKTQFKNKKIFKGMIKDFNYLEFKKYLLNKLEDEYQSVFIGSEFTQKLDKYCELVYNQVKRI